MTFLSHQNLDWLILLYFRSHAIACVNQFIINRTEALMVHIDHFIEVSFSKRPYSHLNKEVTYQDIYIYFKYDKILRFIEYDD